MKVRESYDLPPKPPVPHRQWALMVVVAIMALVLWRVLPDSPVVVALLAIILLATVFFGVWRVLSSRSLREPPGHDPMPPRG
jgi:uncharacterized membrane protein YccC